MIGIINSSSDHKAQMLINEDDKTNRNRKIKQIEIDNFIKRTKNNHKKYVHQPQI